MTVQRINYADKPLRKEDLASVTNLHMGTEGKNTLILEKESHMRALITCQVFPPEAHPTSIIVGEMAEYMARHGIDVTVATGFPNHPYGRLYPGYRKQLVSIEKNNGFQVVRCWHLINASRAMIPQGLVMASQCAGFILGALHSSRPDVIISVAPPVIGPLASSLIARATGAKLINVVYDFYPDVLIETGKLQNPVLIKAALELERFVYHCSDHIVALSEGFRRTLIQEKGLDPGKVTVIPVWLNGLDVIPMYRDNPWRREMGIGPEKFVVLYAGTIGLVSGAEVVINAARLLEDHPDILFLMVGAGYAKDRMEAEARITGLKNIRFLPLQPRERLSEVQATADVSLVTLAPGRGKTSVPSKVLGYMAAARPVIAAVDQNCDTADLIRTADCGLVTPPAVANLLAEAILHLFNNPGLRRKQGEKGRKYFEEKLERQQVLAKYGELLERVVHKK